MTDPRPHDFDGFETLGRIIIGGVCIVIAALALVWLFGGV